VETQKTSKILLLSGIVEGNEYFSVLINKRSACFALFTDSSLPEHRRLTLD